MKTHCFLYYILCLSLLFSLCACGRETAETVTVVEVMLGTQMTLPAGQIYSGGAAASEEMGEKEYAEEEMLAVMYGGGTLPLEFETVNSYAIWLCGFACPYEMAVFRCVSAQDAFEVAQMCLRRAEALRVNCRETEFAAAADGAQVSVMGKYVLMAVCEDAQSAIEAGRRAIRGGGG